METVITWKRAWFRKMNIYSGEWFDRHAKQNDKDEGWQRSWIFTWSETVQLSCDFHGLPRSWLLKVNLSFHWRISGQDSYGFDGHLQGRLCTSVHCGKKQHFIDTLFVNSTTLILLILTILPMIDCRLVINFFNRKSEVQNTISP